ncbi:MAG: hypothetical protein JW994_07155 [Candidatus Omnitrophica bacterium]|nr:hypothetical protein [Candidatus Omnitrophota bacterium]
MEDYRDVVCAIFFFAFGVWYFFFGFNRFRRKRLIENIPTSTIRGLAMGLVELSGKAETKIPIKSPLTQTDCVLYMYKIEERRRSGRSSSWATIASGNSFAYPFLVNDGTGRAMVFPTGAEMILPVDYKFTTGIFKDMPETLIDFMEKNRIRHSSWLGSRTLRFKEWFIKENEPVYILGTAQTAGRAPVDYKKELTRRIKELKKNPHEMERMDLNKDGEISAEEWDLAVSKVEENLLDEILKKSPEEEPVDAIVSGGDIEKVFIISDHSEKELMKKLSWQCFSGIYGGAILSLAMSTYLLFRFKVILFK